MRTIGAVFLATLALAGCGRAGAPAPTPANTAANASAAAPAQAIGNGAIGNGATNDAASGVAALPGYVSPPGATVTVQFQRGANCWRYAGSATTFNGAFSAGQKVDITSTGEADNSNGAQNWDETKPRSVYIAGADGKLLNADASGYFDIPTSGAYQITFDPMSMVGAPGVMVVCTL